MYSFKIPIYFNNFVSFKDPLVPEIARQYKQDREGYNAVNKIKNTKLFLNLFIII